jgi:branched-chain amino acid transport system permease protein
MIGVPAWSPFGTLLAAAVAITVLVAILDRTRFGRECDAIRSDEEAAGSLGVRVERNRALAMVLSAALAGLAGGLQAGYSTAVFPTDFGFALMISAITYVILGGAGAWWGALVGTAVLVELFDAISGFGDARPFVTGFVLIAVVFVAPRGLVGLVDELKDRLAHRGIRRAGEVRPAAAEASGA